MAMKPKSSGNSNGGKQFEDTRNYPTPKAGNRKARISLIVDLGTQKREDFEDKVTGEKKPQKPVQQVVVFADLVNDVVDYGGTIGKKQYRLMLNKSFQGVVQGVNFTTVPPRDADGNLIEGKKWGFHPANLLTKLAKAVGKDEIIVDDGPNGLDIEMLLDQPFLCNVEVKETEGKKKDADGNPIVYKNVNFKAASPVPTDEDEDGNEIPGKVAKLTEPARIISFDSATKEDIQFIRSNLIAMIKNATDYAGSQMQKAIEAYEAENGGAQESNSSKQETKKEEAPAKVKESNKSTKAKPVPVDDDDSDVPF